MNIGIDIDGPVYDWHTCLYRYFVEEREFEGSQVQFWDYFRTLDTETQDYYVALPFLYFNTSPKEGVIEYLGKLAELGKLYYITSRDRELETITRKFFDFFDLPFKENILFSKDKANNARLLKLDFFIDDLPHNVDALKPVVKTYLLAVPHNVNQREGYDVVYGLKEFYERIGGRA